MESEAEYRAEPLFNKAQQLVAYACPTCGQVIAAHVVNDAEEARELAATHCDPRCGDCGASVRNSRWYACDVCSARRARERGQRRFEAAIKLTSDEWNGPVFAWDEGSGLLTDEGYFASLTEAIESYQANDVPVPTFFFVSKKSPVRVSAERAIDDALDVGDHGEWVRDELVDVQELFDFIEAWNKKQTAGTHEPDFTRVVVVRPVDLDDCDE